MPARRPAPDQPSLLEWQAPQPVARFEPARVRAATLHGQIARAVSECLRDAAAAGLKRETIAERMSAITGQRVSGAMLDAYASQAREEHSISLARFIALMQATGDRRLLELLAEPMGWAVVERADVALIELAELQAHADEVHRRVKVLQAQAKVRRG
jgi:hypothetical protein